MTTSVDLDPAHLIDDVVVVILAAGDGTRLGSKRPKAFVGLAGEALLAWSLRAFEEHDAVDSIVLVVPEDWTGPAEVLVDDVGCDKVASIEIGGPSRAASVARALEAIPNRSNTAVVVHDAARPVVPSSVVDRVLAPLADGWDAVVPGLELVDTVKVVDADGAVVASPDRSTLRAVQTPQACRASTLHAAHDACSDVDLERFTDCAAAVASAGGRVVVVRGDERLAKVTTAADLHRIEAELGGPAAPLPDGDDDDDTHSEDVDAAD